MSDIENKDVWRQIFCAALTGILAGNKPDVKDEDDPFADPAFDAVAFASRVADEACEWELQHQRWSERTQVQELSGGPFFRGKK